MSVNVISKLTCGKIRFLLIATIFSNMTGFVAIVASNFREIFLDELV